MTSDISLYIPAYNAAAHIERCLKGVLAQTLRPAEVIVIDDGSTDETAELAARCQVKVIRHDRNKGLAEARNTGVRSASHEFVASLDSDCVAQADWLEQLVVGLEEHGAAGAGGRLIETNCTRLPDRWRTSNMRQHWGEDFVPRPHFLFGNNTLFRKSALLSAGLYNTKFRTNFEDVAMSEQLVRLGNKLIYTPSAVVFHLRSDTISSVIRTNWKWRFPAYRYDVNLRSFISAIRRERIGELKYFLGNDLRRRDPAAAILSLAAIAYAVFSDVRYLVQHNGEGKSHSI
jgi:glycosyltransferase involved in cell wall biosynthesis